MTHEENIIKALNEHKSASLGIWSMRATGSMLSYRDFEIQDADSCDYKPFDGIIERKIVNCSMYLIDVNGNIRATAFVPVTFYKDRRKNAFAHVTEVEIYDSATCEMLYKGGN